jgi:hypothetical protein
MMAPGPVRANAAGGRYRRAMLLPWCAVVAGLTVGLLTGGRLHRLAEAQLRLVPLLVAGAVLEAAGSLWLSGGWGLAALLAGYVSLLAFALANAARTGMILVAAGLLANLVVIAVDGGMPVRGLAGGISAGARHHGIRAGDHLTFLADVVHLPALSETVSAGDIVLSIGVATVIVGLLHTPPRRRPAPVRKPGRQPDRAAG